MAFFAALVEMDVLREVIVSFLLVGHTGNEESLQSQTYIITSNCQYFNGHQKYAQMTRK